MTTRRKNKSEPKVHRVYCTYLPEGTYYIGYSCKTEKLYEKYFGSSKEILERMKQNPEDHGFEKETIAVYTKKSHAKALEHLLQWEFRFDEKCLNDMWNVRLRLSHLKDMEIPEWKPNLRSHSVRTL